MKILNKLAPTINNAMRVYFEEIFTALMDELLTEEVIKFKINRSIEEEVEGGGIFLKYPKKHIFLIN